MTTHRFILTDDQWQEFEQVLDAPLVDAPKLRALLTSPSVFDNATDEALIRRALALLRDEACREQATLPLAENDYTRGLRNGRVDGIDLAVLALRGAGVLT